MYVCTVSYIFFVYYLCVACALGVLFPSYLVMKLVLWLTIFAVDDSNEHI